MKFLKYFMALVAAAGLMTACESDLEVVEALPAEAATKPVFHDPDVDEVIVTTLNQTSRSIAFDWEPANFGVNAQINYALVASYGGNSTNVIAGVTDTEVSITFEILNTAVALAVEDGGLGLIANVKQDVEFRISASIGNGTIYSEEAYTIPVSPIAADKTYPTIYAIGGFVGWDWGQVTAQSTYLYDFTEKGKIYEGVIAFNGKAQDGFKFSGALKWDDSCNWGTDGEAEAPVAEAKTVQLINSGASGNLSCYSKKFYHFTFDRSELKLTNDFSFDVLTMNGKEMAFNAYKRRFWVDVENLSGTIEFTADEGTIKWGAGEVEGQLAQDGGTITVAEAGNYRVYAYLSELGNPYYEISAVMYGMDEPAPASGGSSNPDQATTWAIYGDLNAEAEGLEMADLINGGGENHMLYFNTPENLQFCLVDAMGLYWRGAEETTLVVGEPVELVSNGNHTANLNLTAPAAGTYLVKLNVKEEKVTLTFENVPESQPNKWGIVGSFNGWGGQPDYYMDPVEGNDNLFVAKNFIADSAESYKVRFNNTWGQDRGMAGNDPLRANTWTRAGVNNFSIAAAGTYDIYFDLYENYIYIMEAGKSYEKATEADPLMVGDYAWDLDLVRGEKTSEMTAAFIEGGKWIVAKSCLLNAGDTFRLHAFQKGDDGKIKSEYFYTVKHAETEVVALAAGESVVLKRDGSAALEVAETGAYDIYFDFAKQTLWLMLTGETPEGVTPAPDQVFSLCGTMTNNWTEDLNLTAEEIDGVEYLAYKGLEVVDGDKFKVRYAASWNTNFGLTFKGNAIEVNTWMPVKIGGEDITVKLAADEEEVAPAEETPEEKVAYDFYFDLEAKKIYLMEEGKLPSEATAGKVAIPTACKFYIHSTDNWEEMYLYGWELDGYDFGAWPGIKLDPAKKEIVNEVEYWVHEFPETVAGQTAGGFVFSAGQDKPQTVDVKTGALSKDRYFTIEAQVGSEKCAVTEIGGDENDDFQGEDTTWALAGVVNGGEHWDDSILFQTTETSGLFVVKQVSIASDFAEFKVKVVGTWDGSVSSNISGIKMNHWVEASSSASGNTSVAKAGVYDIYYDSVNNRIYVMAMGADIAEATQQTASEKPSDDALLKQNWYVAGTMNGWADNADYKLTADFNDNCLYIDLALTTSDEFKIKSSKWYGYNDGALSAGNTYKLVDGGNMKVSANGNYQLRWYPSTEELKVIAK